MPRSRLAVLALTAAALALGAPSFAQDPGVVVDPDSPTGKEYEIPLESARRDADPAQPEGAAPGGREAPLFGEGVETPRARAAQESGSRRSGNTAPGGREATRRPPKPPARDPADERVLRAATGNPGAPGGGASSLFLIGGAGLGVLLAGGAAGVALRRRAR